MGESSDPEQHLTLEIAESTETPIAQPVSRKRRNKSPVWEHFTVESAGNGTTRACCKLCKQTFAYSSGSKVAGTSHLKRHITLGSCPKLKQQLALASGLKIDGDASYPPRGRYRTTLNSLFDQDPSSENLAKMIIIHEYPLHMVEQPAVAAFARSLQPRFRMPTFNEIEGEVFSVYHKERQNLMQVFGTMSCRISLTICLWTTSQTLGYVCLNGQFIDNDWKLHRRMLNFTMVSSPHSENALSKAVRISLSEWNMKNRLFTITLDNNCSSHDIYSVNLRDHLRGQLFVVQCYTNILNVIAHDVIASIHGIIYNIRESVKFVKASPNREEKFAEIALQLEIPSAKSLSLDVSTQWDTTYHMLVSAVEYKHAFIVLETCDDHYNEAPSTEDWRKVEVACTYLKLLDNSARAIEVEADPTANIFFQEAWKIELELSHAISSEDVVVNGVAREMHEKFDKYWKDCSLILAIAVVMDPRFKMKLVEFSFSRLYGEDAPRYVKAVDDAVHELYQEYVSSQPILSTPSYEEQGVEGNDSINGLLDFDMYISETADTQNAKPEIEQYLEESVVPRVHEFDVLNWWKLNTIKYPTLSKMARDLLAIPLSMVTPGSNVFSVGNGSRVLDEYRSSLRPEIVKALFCTKDWLQYLPTMAEPPLMHTLVKMEYQGRSFT